MGNIPPAGNIDHTLGTEHNEENVCIEKLAVVGEQVSITNA